MSDLKLIGEWKQAVAGVADRSEESCDQLVEDFGKLQWSEKFAILQNLPGQDIRTKTFINRLTKILEHEERNPGGEIETIGREIQNWITQHPRCRVCYTDNEGNDIPVLEAIHLLRQGQMVNIQIDKRKSVFGRYRTLGNSTAISNASELTNWWSNARIAATDRPSAIHTIESLKFMEDIALKRGKRIAIRNTILQCVAASVPFMAGLAGLIVGSIELFSLLTTFGFFGGGVSIGLMIDRINNKEIRLSNRIKAKFAKKIEARRAFEQEIRNQTTVEQQSYFAQNKKGRSKKARKRIDQVAQQLGINLETAPTSKSRNKRNTTKPNKRSRIATA